MKKNPPTWTIFPIPTMSLSQMMILDSYSTMWPIGQHRRWGVMDSNRKEKLQTGRKPLIDLRAMLMKVNTAYAKERDALDEFYSQKTRRIARSNFRARKLEDWRNVTSCGSVSLSLFSLFLSFSLFACAFCPTTAAFFHCGPMFLRDFDLIMLVMWFLMIWLKTWKFWSIQLTSIN